MSNEIDYHNNPPEPQKSVVADANKQLNCLYRVYACDEDCFALYKMSGGPRPYPGPYPVVHGSIEDCLREARKRFGRIEQ